MKVTKNRSNFKQKGKDFGMLVVPLATLHWDFNTESSEFLQPTTVFLLHQLKARKVQNAEEQMWRCDQTQVNFCFLFDCKMWATAPKTGS